MIMKTGLESGKRYYFRVAIVNRYGVQPWSNVVNVIVG
ncbi:MAG TPA: fibronectin type III domain-containing protein [Bacteroidia bacterium]